MAIIDLKHVSKMFGKETIFDDINLKIEKGTIVGIVGRNGSGKSVLFKMICGLMSHNNGEIFVCEKKIENGCYAENVGIILDSTGFIPNLNAFDNLKSIAVINQIADDKRIWQCICMVGLEEHKAKKVRKYSLGMKQRLAFAQAIMEKPEVLILDEPFNGLDEEGVLDIRNILIELKEQGTTILIASHIKEDIDVLCDKVYHIEKEKITLIR